MRIPTRPKYGEWSTQGGTQDTQAADTSLVTLHRWWCIAPLLVMHCGYSARVFCTSFPHLPATGYQTNQLFRGTEVVAKAFSGSICGSVVSHSRPHSRRFEPPERCAFWAALRAPPSASSSACAPSALTRPRGARHGDREGACAPRRPAPMASWTRARARSFAASCDNSGSFCCVLP